MPQVPFAEIVALLWTATIVFEKSPLVHSVNFWLWFTGFRSDGTGEGF